MKILLISRHAKSGGAAIATYRLLQTLRQQNIEAHMLVQEDREGLKWVHDTTNSVGKRWLNLARFIWERILFVMRERSRPVRFLFSLANTGEQITGYPQFREADVIHLHWINGGFLSLRSLEEVFQSGKPVVWTFHDMWAFTGGCHYSLECEKYRERCGLCPFLRKPRKGDISRRIWERKNRLYKDHAFQVVTPSSWLKERVAESSLLGGRDVRVIHNPVDQTRFKPMDRNRACEILDLDPERKYILFGAATVNNILKGFEYFAEAVHILDEETRDNEPAEILVFGKSRKDLYRYFPIRTRIFSFTGSTEKIVALYNAAHLFAIPSLQDNLPNTVVESLLCGTPVVGFRSGGIPEMIEHEKNGYLAERRSSRELADGMKWVILREDYGKLRNTVREDAVRRFSMEKSAEMHVELYRQMMKGG